MAVHKLIGLTTILLLCTISFAWLDGWEYRRPINISTSSDQNNLRLTLQKPSTTTDENGVATAYLNDIPLGADKLTIQIGSQSTTKSFSTSPGVQSVQISARVFVKGSPVFGKTVEFEIS